MDFARLLAIFLTFAAESAVAQIHTIPSGSAQVLTGSGAPCGTCANARNLYVDTAHHALYVCPAANGTWVQSLYSGANVYTSSHTVVAAAPSHRGARHGQHERAIASWGPS